MQVSRRTLESLEWPLLIERLQALARTPGGRRRCEPEARGRALRPDPDTARARLAETSEARALLTVRRRPSAGSRKSTPCCSAPRRGGELGRRRSARHRVGRSRPSRRRSTSWPEPGATSHRASPHARATSAVTLDVARGDRPHARLRGPGARLGVAGARRGARRGAAPRRRVAATSRHRAAAIRRSRRICRTPSSPCATTATCCRCAPTRAARFAASSTTSRPRAPRSSSSRRPSSTPTTG